ncbi:MAG TPA: DMT family transporter [Methanocorpusculum sp.]|nr:DMT family transporter [Methanocorpusculum sp.]
MNKTTQAVILAVTAALIFSLHTPVSALLLENSGPMGATGFMNIAVGIVALLIFICIRNKKVNDPARHLRKTDIPALILMNIADFLGSVFLMLGLTLASSTSASLMLNFEIVAAAVLAMVYLKEKIAKPLWIAVTLITLGCITVSSGAPQGLFASPGLFLILLTCVCWAFGNVLKKKVAERNPSEILAVRGFSIGTAGLVLMFVCGEEAPSVSTILLLCLTGLIAYGVGTMVLLIAQRELSGAKSTTIIGISPFLSAVWSLIIFHEAPTLSFFIGLLLLVPGFYMATTTKDYEVDIPKADYGEVPELESLRSDTYFEVRNYLTSLGFILISVSSLIMLLANISTNFDHRVLLPHQFELELSIWAFLVIIGILLIIIRKRNIAGITFLIYGLSAIILAFTNQNRYLTFMLGIFTLIISGIFLLDASKKKYIFFTLFFSEGISMMIWAVPGLESMYYVLEGMFILFTLYLGFAASNLLPHIHGTDRLTSDEVFSFKRCGSMLGYIILALGFIPWALMYILGSDAVSVSDSNMVSAICSVFLFITALLLLFIGHARFTSVIFIGVSFVFWISQYVSGMAFYVLGIILLIFGLFAICRKKSFLLVALMLILFGISAFSSITVSGMVELYLPQILLNVIPSIIALYLAAALFSSKNRLPLF